MGKRNRRQKKGAMAAGVAPSAVPAESATITPDKACKSESPVQTQTKAAKSPLDGSGTPGKITDFFPRSPEGGTGQADVSERAEEEEEEEKKLLGAALALPLPVGLLTPDTTPTKDTKPRPPRRLSLQGQTAGPDQPDPQASAERPRAAHRLEYATAGHQASAKGEGQADSPPTDTQPAGTETEKSAGKPSRKGKGRQRKSKQSRQVQSPGMTLKDYFPVRRSNRQCKSAIEAEQTKMLHEAILSGQEEGAEVVNIPGKGRGVVATKLFHKGDFVVEYHGEHIDIGLAREREREYAANPSIGCYMYYYKHKNKSYCVDATSESGRLGRLLNHSKAGNCTTRLVSIQGRPYLILVAARTVSAGEELVYDYGDRDKESLQSHPWLAL